MKMKYAPAAVAGVQLLYALSKKDALLLNANVSHLTAGGNFTIVLTAPIIGPQPPNYQNIKTFSVIGGEQRIFLQTGYRRILGDDNIVNFFVEAGPFVTMTKFLKNQATINNLYIDMGSFYSQPYYATYRARYLRGTGLGAFAGFGIDLSASMKWSLQLFYSPSYELINIAEFSKRKLQNTMGLRIFYNM